MAVDLSVQLLQRYAERGMVAEALAEARQLGRQLADGRQMIDSMIAYASLVSKLAAPRPEPTDLAGLVRESTAPLLRMAETHEVALRYAVAEPLPSVVVDRQQVSEAIHHLVHNAIKFNRPGGEVRVRCHTEASSLALVVEDDGPGIAPEKLATIWDAFAQAGDDVQRGVEGLGLGLALVSCIVKAHRGALLAESTPGKGSAFGFYLAVGYS